MTPKINFADRDGRLIIKIYLHRTGRGLYDTGIKIYQWDEATETTGDPDVNAWMASTKATLLKQFRPDMTPKRLWMSFVNNQSETTATIKDAFDYYLANMPMKPSTVVVYNSIVKSLVKAGIHTTPLCDVTPALLRSFLNGLIKNDSTKLMDSSKFNSFCKIKGAVTRYIRDHRLNIDIDWEGIAKKPKFVRKEDEWLTLAEVETLWRSSLQWQKKDARDLFVLCCVSGMSMSDVLKFDPKKNIKISNGNEFFEFTRIKTGSKCRIPVTTLAKEVVESRNWPINMRPRSFQYHVAETLGPIVGKKLHSHMGRKTAGALFLEFGFSVEAVSSFLGHSNINQTQRTYTTITSKKIENEMERVLASGTVAFSEPIT